MNIQFNPTGNVKMTLVKPVSATSKVLGFGRPAVIPSREVAFTSVRVGALDSGGTTDYTTEASNDTVNDVPGPFYSTIDEVDNTLYLGFTEPFNAVKLKVGTPIDASNNLLWRYFTGVGAFGNTNVPNIQETVSGLKNLRTSTEGIVYWDIPNDWIATQPQVSMALLYWIIIYDTQNLAGEPPRITRILKTTPP